VTTGYHERIQKALVRGPRPLTLRRLHRELEEGFPDVPGTSYSGVRKYSAGQVKKPRIELLNAMASVLGVRPEWLAFGEGEMTEELQEARRMTAESPTHPRFQDPVDWSVVIVTEALRRTPMLRGYSLADVEAMAFQLLAHASTSVESVRVDPDILTELAEPAALGLSDFVMEAWERVHGATPSEDTELQFRRFAVGLLHTLTLAFPPPGERDPREYLSSIARLGDGYITDNPPSEEPDNG
jgi:hypothetical protein